MPPHQKERLEAEPPYADYFLRKAWQNRHHAWVFHIGSKMPTSVMPAYAIITDAVQVSNPNKISRARLPVTDIF